MVEPVVVRTVLQGLTGVQAGLGQIGIGLSTLGIKGLSVAAAFTTLSAAVGKGFRDLEAQNVQNLRMTAVLSATGQASGKTAESIGKLVDAMKQYGAVSGTELRDAATSLLSFRTISGETFDRTMKAAVDLAATGFGSVSSAAFTLGRSLEDSEIGMTALRRSGILLDDQQRNAIKTFLALGDRAGAMNVILKEVESTVGGAGGKTSSGLTGAFNRLQGAATSAFKSFADSTGGLAVLEKAAKAAETIFKIFSALNSPEFALSQAKKDVQFWQQTLDAMSKSDSNRLSAQEALNAALEREKELRGGIEERKAKENESNEKAEASAEDAAKKRKSDDEAERTRKLNMLKSEQDFALRLAQMSDKREKEKVAAEQSAEEAVLRQLGLEKDKASLAKADIDAAKARARAIVEAGHATEDEADRVKQSLEWDIQREKTATQFQVQQKLRLRGYDDEIKLLGLRNADLEVAKEIMAAENQLLDEQGEKRRELTEEERASIQEGAKRRFKARKEKEEYESLISELSNFASRAFDRIGDQITRMFVEGKQSAIEWKNVFRGILSEIIQELIKLAVINPIKNALFGNIAGFAPALFTGASLFGNGSMFSAGQAAFTTMQSPIGFSGGGFDIASGATFYHSGGMVGAHGRRGALSSSFFAGAPRFHNGVSSLASDEIPAILQRGEEVIPANKASRRGDGIVIEQTLQIQTGVSQTVRAEVMAMMPRILNATKAAVAEASRRGGEFRGAFK